VSLDSRPTADTGFRAVWNLAWPLILSNMTVPLLGLVDTAVVGHLPDSEYLGAVTLGATLFSFLYWGFGFLRMGTTGLVAQAWGSSDGDALRLLLAQGLALAAVIGLALLLLGPLLIPLGLGLLDGSRDVSTLAATYAGIRLLSAPAVLVNYVLIGWFIGIGRTRVTLGLMVLNNAANIVLDLLFVPVLGWTVDGVALASVLADGLTAVTGLWLARRHLRDLPGRLDVGALTCAGRYRRLLDVNAALFVRTLALLFALAFFHAQGAQMGDVTLAANAVLMQFIMLTSYGLDGFAHAAESLVGRTLGSGDRAGFARAVRATLFWSLATAVVAATIFAVGGRALIALLTDIETVRQAAARFLPWMVAMPLIAVWSYLLDGIFIGATRTRAMCTTMLAAVFGVYLPVWLLTRDLGNHGLWLAFTVFTLARSAALALTYLRDQRRGGWFETKAAAAH
jgi:MATE family multidrug resistance protein